MEAKNSPLTFLLLLILNFSQFSLSTSKRIIDNPSSSSASLWSHNAERQIKSFNLTPKYDVNVIPKGSPNAPRLIETRFDFPATIGVNNPPGGPSVLQFGHYAGYYNLPHSKSAKMFYYFFESRSNTSDPVVIWLYGGPGCSSSISLFYENGPFKISKNLSLSWNDFGWDKVSNILYVDNPVGTGFSYSSDSNDLRHDEFGVSTDLYDFLQDFFKEHPKFAKNDFYITGESYAGHYIPALASRIHNANKQKQGIPINLKGIAMGNGLTNSEIQFGSYGDYALEMKLISQSDHESLKKDYIDCQKYIKNCNSGSLLACSTGFDVCQNMYNKIVAKKGDKNCFDLRKKCPGGSCFCYDYSSMETFLNREDVRKALGVGNIKFVSCNLKVYDAMKADWMVNLEPQIPVLIEDGIKVLVYAGEYDLICNWIGNYRWVNEMNWPGKNDFVSAKNISFVVDGKEAGLMKNHASLTFLKVHEAGHLVPMDQPNVSLQMIQKWMHGTLTT